MKIVQIIPGTGDTYYCQNCMRDRELVMELRLLGHDVILAPMYLPVFSEGEDIGTDVPVFYGAVGVYLSQYFPSLSNAPQWLKRLIDSRRLLGWIAQKSGTTRASGLEEMTLSILKGENGGQKKELGRLVSWLVQEGKPDVVHLSNALLLGLAGRIKNELGVPVVCTLQDEDAWIDSMEPDAARKAWDLMAEKSSDISAFVPVSNYYSDLMQKRLKLGPERFHVVPIGINIEGYGEARLSSERPVIGYLSNMTESLGLGVMVDAFIILKDNDRLKNLKLKVLGGQTPEDRPFLRHLRRKLASKNMGDDVEFLSEFDRNSRIEFIRTLSVMSVPVPHPEAFGMYIVEALACGVPVVQPKVGAFPEIVEATGGGICYEPNDAVTLAKTLESLLLDPECIRSMGQSGRKVVLENFSVKKTAASMLEVYRKCLKG
ncbi:MAG: glycosyltransferase family 4 protein [Kiritimatiellae bacterium]|nr:glycosyltransferase family 4 protein [Kiritimatiellia bacterium]